MNIKNILQTTINVNRILIYAWNFQMSVLTDTKTNYENKLTVI